MKIPKKFYDRLKVPPKEDHAELFWVVCIKQLIFKDVVFNILNTYIAKDKSDCVQKDNNIYVYIVNGWVRNEWDGRWMKYEEYHQHFMKLDGG